MENQRNHNKNLQICTTTQNVQLTSSTQIVSSIGCSSITPLRNHRLFNPRLNRLTAVKRLARRRRKTYPKYGPYPCQWCDETLPTSQHFASHMRSHYIDAGIALNPADKQAQEHGPQLSPAEARENARVNRALRHAKAELEKARKRTEELTLLLAQANARSQASGAPVPAVPVPARAPKDINTELVVFKHQVFPDEDVKPPPGFQHLLGTGPDGRRFIIRKMKLEYVDDDVSIFLP